MPFFIRKNWNYLTEITDSSIETRKLQGESGKYLLFQEVRNSEGDLSEDTGGNRPTWETLNIKDAHADRPYL